MPLYRNPVSSGYYAPPPAVVSRPVYVAPTPVIVQPLPAPVFGGVVTNSLPLPTPQPLVGVPSPGGETALRIIEILPGPAAAAGLKVGDVITKIAGLRVHTLAETRAALTPIANSNIVVEYLDGLTGRPASKIVALDASQLGATVVEVPLN